MVKQSIAFCALQMNNIAEHLSETDSDSDMDIDQYPWLTTSSNMVCVERPCLTGCMVSSLCVNVLILEDCVCVLSSLWYHRVRDGFFFILVSFL